MHILLLFGWFGGWVLGIIGFFSALSAHAQLRRLHAMLSLQELRPAGSGETAEVGFARVPPRPIAQLSGAPPADAPSADAPPAVNHPPARLPPPRDLEALLTTNWGVWVGSAALLLAGVFLVRYAVEQELLGPAARCGLAALLGAILLGGAEFLHRHEGPPLAGPFRIDQAPSGLAAGGTAFLFGAAYGAGPFYALLPPLPAFAAMAAASLVALAAALRYGPLTAATGIAGAFATPALVATAAPSLPGLFSYLLVVSAAALLVVRRTAWTWLGWAATIAGAAWVVFAGLSAAPDGWAAAAFVPAAAALNLLLLPGAALDHPVGRRLAWVPFATLGAAGLVLEIVIPGIAASAALLLLSPVAVGKGIAEPRLDRLPWVGALFGLLTLLVWTSPAWTSAGGAVRAEGIVQAILPGAWAPEAVVPLLAVAAVLAGFHAAAGLWLERRAANKLPWAALVAAVPVLSLAVAYARVARFQTGMTQAGMTQAGMTQTGMTQAGMTQTGMTQTGITWAAAALVLTAALTATAAAAARANDRQRAGVHAAGAVAALALGCAMLLHDYWLTLAVALLLPALAWIEARAELPALRQVALAVAALVIVRLVLNWYVLDYAFGTMPLANGLLAGYAAPAASFAVAAALFRRRGDDRLVAALQGGAVALLALFVALEIRHWSGDGDLQRPFSFNEAALHVLTLAVQATAYLYLAQRDVAPNRVALGGVALGGVTPNRVAPNGVAQDGVAEGGVAQGGVARSGVDRAGIDPADAAPGGSRVVLTWAWQVVGSLALAGAVGLLALNPMVSGASAGVLTLFAGYLGPACLAALACRMVPQPDRRTLIGAYAVVAGFAWITLQIRQLFHPDALALEAAPIEAAELWGWSGGWLVYGIALMAGGIRSGDRLLRLTALGVIAIVCAKVFAVDMSGLTGLWRVLSFLGLGLALIGLGTVYRRFVLSADPERDKA
jgi:uncharacterized membrane protein